MANRKVIIVSRTGTGRKFLPAAPGMFKLYLRYYEGDRPVHFRVRLGGVLLDTAPESDNWDDAEIGKGKLERKLDARARGYVLPEDQTDPAPTTKCHRITEVIARYIAEISKPDEDNKCRPQKSIASYESELTKFREWSKRTYLHEITTDLLTEYRRFLQSEKYQPDTVINKLMCVITWLKHNPVKVVRLEGFKFPKKKKTIPDPYSEAEFNAMMEKATYEEALLIFFFITTGMREQEIAHAEGVDIVNGQLMIFRGKTDAAARNVDLDPVLLAELKLRGTGLLFPSPTGRVHQKFLRDVIEPLARKAGVVGTAEKPHMIKAGMVRNDWCHRFRDTFITNSLHETSTGKLMEFCEMIGHADTNTLRKYFRCGHTTFKPVFPEDRRKAKPEPKKTHNVTEMRKSA